MAIRQCKLVAIEGPQGSGKTTIIHALTAEFKRQHIHAAHVAEATRESPFFEDAVFRGIPVDIYAELHIFGTLIAQEHRIARNHDLLFCDRTLMSVLAYSRILLDATSGSLNQTAIHALEEFCRMYAQVYDLTFFVTDQYDLTLTKDPFRPAELNSGQSASVYRQRAESALRMACADVGLKIIELPVEMELPDKVAWISDQIKKELFD